ncbi:MAG: GDP-L-fucose synthase [Verrucomicrobia bacterium]|nr:GDP-L-fucose synthase [Verrucomicrobiota bacterium]MCH8510800.1 GDP-L-fucose synthase [Kiritimatiellia bacterium]
MPPLPPIFVAGHRGMVGSAVVRALRARGHERILTRTRGELDLLDAAAVNDFFARERPKTVILCAAKVGGIHANRSFPADFMRENLGIALNVIEAARAHGVTRLLNLGSSCIYPRDAAQPLREEALLTGPLETTNEAYALAKIAALKLCAYIRQQYGLLFHSAMPTNLYGPGDNYHPENSHVIPGLLRRLHEAKVSGADSVTIWGTGTPRREFLHADDLAEALLYLLEAEDPPDVVNIGAGKDIPIRELADLIAETVGFQGQIHTDPSMPDGTPRKCLDISKITALGWRPRIPLKAGLEKTYADFRERAKP